MPSSPSPARGEHAPRFSVRVARSFAVVAALAVGTACSTSALPEPKSSSARETDSPQVSTEVEWLDWSNEVFERAKREHKLVLLDLEAVWCHWCHVMDETTYADPAVRAELAAHFVCVRVDQDSRPDLANRYEDYGWPATILYDGDARELAKRSGYIAPVPMAEMLRAFVADPTPGPSARTSRAESARRAPRMSADGNLDARLRVELEQRLEQSYDTVHASWGTTHKYVEATNLEHVLVRALEGDADAERQARATLDAGLALLDPAWGGFYQYSTGGVWTEPHFEKIASMQSAMLRLYALAARVLREPRYAQAARSTARYLREFLTSPDGAFYTSQDADLVQGEHAAEYFALDAAQRAARGIPRIDRNVYARENGAHVRALCELYATSGDADALSAAERATRWVLAHRAIEGGGFRHGERDTTGPFLGDTLSMGQACLALHETTGDREWLTRALEASSFIDARFQSADGVGYVTAAARAGESGAFAPRPQRDENLEVARFEAQLVRLTEDAAHRARALRAHAFVTSRDVADAFPFAAALLCDELVNAPSVHIAIVGARSDARTLALHTAALRRPAVVRAIECVDPTRAADAERAREFGGIGEPAAFVCGNQRCSAPAFDADELEQRIASFER